MAKKRAQAIYYSRGQRKKGRSEEAPALSRANRCHPRNPGRAARAAEQLANIAGTAAERRHARLSHYLPLIG